MDRVFRVVYGVSSGLNYIAGAALTFMMFLTFIDVAMRAVARPFIGTYEVVSILMGIVVGFGIPKVSLDRAHVQMEFVTDKLAKTGQAIFYTFTRILCIILFIFIGANLIGAGNEFRMSHEVSQTLQIPFYPVAYGVGVCCFIECIVFICDIFRIWKTQNE